MGFGDGKIVFKVFVVSFVVILIKIIKVSVFLSCKFVSVSRKVLVVLNMKCLELS